MSDQVPPDEAPRAYTAEEVRKQLLGYLHMMLNYWENVPDAAVDAATAGESISRYKLSGMVFSILAMFDGCAGGMPAFDLSPSMHPDDKAYYIEQGENWYDVDEIINECQLHDLWYARNGKSSLPAQRLEELQRYEAARRRLHDMLAVVSEGVDLADYLEDIKIVIGEVR